MLALTRENQGRIRDSSRGNPIERPQGWLGGKSQCYNNDKTYSGCHCDGYGTIGNMGVDDVKFVVVKKLDGTARQRLGIT
jgi:hypothetical protein